MTYEQVIKRIFIQNPFYGLVLMGMPIEDSSKVSTACVGLDKASLTYTMQVNPKFWNSLKDQEQVEVFKHELLHVCFFHCLSMKDFKDWNLFNYAADAEVNQYLEKRYLPEGCIDILAEYPGIQPKAGVKYYYEFLQQHKPLQQQDGNGNGEGQDSQSSLKGKLLDDHSLWRDAESMSEAEKELLAESLNKTLVEAYQNAKGRGTIPGSLEEYIGTLLNRKQIFNWKAYFRRLIGNAEETWIKVSRKKESRRFDGGAGIKKIHFSNILVGVDTSGSVSNDELREFFTEMRHISKTKNVVVDVSEFDSVVHRTYRFSGKFTGKIEGRGGTDFQPVVDFYNKNRKKYSALIIFTDGYALVPENIPRDCIWVITGNKKDKFPGKVIYMKQFFSE